VQSPKERNSSKRGDQMKTRLGILIGGFATASLLATGMAQSQTPPTTTAQTDSLEEVIVTGFRQSLKSSTEAKREAVGFVDSIFAEDIGKFPDTNIAESFNRIPGVTITRDLTGEGLNVAIRGLNTNFTRVLLNNAPVAIASTGQDNGNSNREVDLDLFPTELFSQLTVAKTPTADMVEGGAAGTVNMRMARPFDSEGQRFTYALQGIDNNKADGTGTRGSMVASGTWGSFGALVGVAGIRNKVNTTGFETIGWTSMNLTQAQCGFTSAGAPLPCNATGGTGAGPGQFTPPTPTSPATLPINSSTTANGIAGATYDQAFLLANNPGLSIQQIDNALLPRLGRPMFDEGDKDRYNGVVSLEFRPSDDLHFFLDSMYGKKENDLERVDMMWLVRRTSQGGLVVPLNMQVDRENCATGCVITSGTFANSQFALEYRHYDEETEFWGTNPGMTWQIADTLSLDVQANFTHSEFRSEVPTVLLITEPSTVTFTNNGGIPSIVSDMDLNNPANFKWFVNSRGGGNEVGRVDMTAQERQTETQGGRFALTWGDADLNLKFGVAFDDVSRDIRPQANTTAWQNTTCGGNPSATVVQPNTVPPCRGETAAEIAQSTGYPTFVSYSGSLIPNAAVPNYLRPTSNGFATVDWNSFARDSNYDAILAQATENGATPTTASWGSIGEETTGFFTQLSGAADIGENRLRYNLGIRFVQTDQSVQSRLTKPDPRNAELALPDGSRFPDVALFVKREREYENWLPSANLSWNLTDNALVRAGLSRTMTRANPSDMLLGLSIPNADVSSVNLGNPELDPYLSDNIDVGFEYYTGAEGYFGVAAFRKGLEGFTTRQVTTVLFRDLAQYGVTLESLGTSQQTSVINRGGLDAPVQLNQTVNASGRLIINGLEFNWVQPLDFLLGGIGLDGFGFTANYTIIDQKGSGAAPAIAIGVPPETYNATLYYENHGVTARVSVTSAEGSQGSGPNSNQSQITGAEYFGEDYQQWDFSASLDFASLLGWSDVVPQLTLDVINITEETRRTYFQFSNAPFTEFDSGRTVIFGLRGTF
jgi:TonB-dependent receptor